MARIQLCFVFCACLEKSFSNLVESKIGIVDLDSARKACIWNIRY